MTDSQSPTLTARLRAAYDALNAEERRVHGGLITWGGRCGREMNELMAAVEALLAAGEATPQPQPTNEVVEGYICVCSHTRAQHWGGCLVCSCEHFYAAEMVEPSSAAPDAERQTKA